MQFDPTLIDEESLANLSDAELEELAAAYEQLHLEEQRTNIVAFALNTEVPGTPSPYSENDRIKMLRRKEALSMARDSSGARVDVEDVEGEIEDTVEFYPQQLEIAEHQQLILESIQALMEETPIVGPLANGHEGVAPEGVMLMFPPGAAKSSYASVIAPAWVLGRYDNTDVISLSYGADLARRFGRRVRHIARTERFFKQFNVSVTADNQAVDQWSLTNGSTYKATGILGGVTGNRADLAIWDDIIAGRDEAESEIIREKTWEALKDDVLTRLKPFGKLIAIGTRWHEDDPMGRVLGEDWEGQSGLWKGTDGRWWLVLCVPLIADRDDDPLGRARGERLWPEWFTERHVELARAQGDRSWNSLQQQKPSASDGNILLKSAWRCWPHGRAEPTDAQRANPKATEPPEFGTWKQCILVYDTAVEEEEQNDYSAMTAWLSFEKSTKIPQRKQAEEMQQNLLMIGAWRARVQASQLITHVMEHIKLFKPDRVVIEKRASGHQLIQELRARRPRHEYGEVIIEAWLPDLPPGAKGKVPRGWSASLSLNEGSIWYMPGPLTEAVIKECAAAPNGRYFDWYDTVTCLTAGHLIALRRGLTPIEKVKAGDEALTPLGWRKVLAAGPTGVRPVLSRHGLTGTADHPVFTLDQGWANLGEATDNVTVSRASLCSLIRTIPRRPWNTGASHSVSSVGTANTILPRSGMTTDDQDSKGFTSPYGKGPMAAMCRRATRSITKTAIHSIAALTIWSAYRKLSIGHCLANARQLWQQTWIACAHSLWRGIDLPRGANGTGRMRSAPVSFSREFLGLGIQPQRSPFLAIIAGRHLSALTSGSERAQPSVTAGSSALPRAAFFEALCERSRRATAALSSSAISSIRTPARSGAGTAAPDSAVVYNLQVEGVHCYYANGVLVHNCMILYARKTNLLEIAPDALSDVEQHEAEEEEYQAMTNPRPSYGYSRSKPYTQSSRSLYGRA